MRGEDCYMLVTPVKTLFKSNLIHGVVTRGDSFAVNLRTGNLTVLRMQPAPRKGISLQVDGVLLSADFDIALIQLAEVCLTTDKDVLVNLLQDEKTVLSLNLKPGAVEEATITLRRVYNKITNNEKV